MSLRTIPPSPDAIRCEAAAYALLCDRLRDEIPDLDEQTLADTLEGATSLHELLAELIRSALTDEALVEGLKGRIADMRERLDRLRSTAERKRALALETMDKVGISKFAAPDFSASLRQGSPGLEIAPGADIPAAYWKPQEPKLDRIGLLSAIKNGVTIDGVALAPPRLQLSVRSK